MQTLAKQTKEMEPEFQAPRTTPLPTVPGHTSANPTIPWPTAPDPTWPHQAGQWNYSVDPSEHLALIWRVISQMGLRGTDTEEAFSEGLVAITKAAQTFDPRKGPVAHWLAKNLRWELKTWRSNHRPTIPLESWVNPGVERVTTHALEIREAIALLDGEERLVIWAHALGYSGKEISKSLKVTQVQVSRIKKRAQQKLKQALPRIY